MLGMPTLLRGAAAAAGALIIAFAASSSTAGSFDDWATVTPPAPPGLKPATLNGSTPAWHLYTAGPAAITSQVTLTRSTMVKLLLPVVPQKASSEEEKCNAGDAFSCNSLGAKYENGDGGLTKDLSRAAELFKKACDEGES